MGYAKNADDVARAFPHGLKYVRDNRQPVDLIDLKVHELRGEPPVLVGWAYPNKDIQIELDNVLVRKNDWLVFSKGLRISLRPLSQGRKEQLEGMME